MTDPDLHPESWLQGTASLPPYVERLAKLLYFEEGVPLEVAIQTAVAAVHTWCSQGTVSESADPDGSEGVSPRTRAQACAATAQWRSLKAKSGSKFDEGRTAASDGELIRWVSQEIKESMTCPLIGEAAEDDTGLEITEEETAALRKFSHG